ncbi:putative GPI-anchored protein 1 [Spathaspora sp. JA1]|nr:putative GPI-anchored protein 1 [Spathaspora sp. JA1]
MNFYILLLSFFTLVYSLGKQGDGQDDTPTTTTSQTIVWVTTTINGQLVTISTYYSQKFTTSSADIAVQSGEIGLGTISGSVGGIREYSQVTITPSGGVGSGAGTGAGLLGLVAVVIGLI